VLDSGIDYTHSKLGGSGSVGDYVACYATNTTIGAGDCPFFPNSKVIGGYDFVGETWPTGSLAPDPDPIAKAVSGFHGTHVADIIGGLESSPVAGDRGVAPGASLYAVKVCSAVSSSCSGVALLQGMDFALDPNGDGDISDAVDVINMSLGSAYGQKEDDLSEASANAVHAGVVVVASAGNNGDRPYIVGSPSSTPEVISVAQTQVPSAANYGYRINSPAGIAGLYQNTETVTWAPIGAGFTGDVAFVGRGCPAGSIDGTNPDDAYLVSPSGKVALIDRGACSVSLKVDRAAKAGAIGVLLGLVASGDPVTFSFGGGTTFVPTLVISQADSNTIKANVAAPVNVTVSPATTTSLVRSMVSSSSRGPSYSDNAIKPDIGAPGASVSAEVGTGTDTTAFGGTSGAAPMVSGSVALLIQKYPKRTPLEIKSLLMNTAETNIQTNPVLLPGSLAPITRIGGGEVRVNRAFVSTTAAWDARGRTGSLSFGYQALTDSRSSGKEGWLRGHDDGWGKYSSFEKEVVVRNYSNRWRTYSITPSFRYADDAASRAVTLSVPRHITVGPRKTETFDVKLKVDPSKLPIWTLNGGSRGGDGPGLQGVEFDGYINIADGTDNVHLAWQILPHRAADVAVEGRHDDDDCGAVSLHDGTGKLRLTNEEGTIDGRVDVFSLTGESPRIPKSLLPHPGDNFAIVDLKSVGVRQVATSYIQFAINTFGERSHPNYPAEYDIYIDVTRDGSPDYVVFNGENGGFGATGQNVVTVYELSTGTAKAYFYTDADLDSANAILTAPLSALGLTPSTQFDFSIYAFDNYFTGNLTDAVEGMTYTPATPRFTASAQTTSVPAGGHAQLAVQVVPGGDVASPSQTGLLLMFRDGKPMKEAAAVDIRP
jgi:subtilisin family serine protease